MLNIIETNLEFNAMNERKSTNRIILHNSGTTVRQAIEIIHNYHKNTKKWAGIGYHFYVRTDGTTYEGRPIGFAGAHAGGNNSDSIGICFEGDFNQETMSEAQMRAGQELVAYLKDKYNISIVQAHRDVCNTSCPGANFPFDTISNYDQTTDTTVTETENVAKEFEKYEKRIGEYQRILNILFNAGLKIDNWWGKDTARATKKHVALKRGMKNELVRWIQKRLIELGFSCGRCGADGHYGTDKSHDTENAVVKFQEKYGLTVDGTAGIQVIRKLVELI